MFLLEPERTQFDLSWRLFGIDVRVHPMFWLMSALLGWSRVNDVDGGLQFLFVWIVCVFVSVLVHELGHVLAGRLFGSDGHIVLYSFGGLAIGSSNQARRWQRNVVYFAGPLAGFLLFGLVFGGAFLLRPLDRHSLAQEAVFDLLAINLYWGILNLLPIWPLDGGRINRETWEWLMPRRGTLVALLLSGIVAAALALNSLAAANGRPFIPYVPGGGWYSAIFFGLLAVSSFQLYQAEGNRRRYGADDSAPWERDDDDWKRPRNYGER